MLRAERTGCDIDRTEPEAATDGEEFERLRRELAELSGALEAPDAWPAAQFRKLAEAGVLGWVIPREYGGSEISAVELTCGYRQLAQACLTTAFVLTQRNGACQRIAGCDNAQLKAELLPRLCAGEAFATVGVSHLTTSRQHWSTPAIAVTETAGGLLLDGEVPWVTGARFADYIVTGGTLSDGRQVLAVVPTGARGVVIGEPAKLLALNASQTGSVGLERVAIDRRYVIAGPVQHVMQRGTGGGTGSLATSALALGTAAAALQRLQDEAERRSDLRDTNAPLLAELEQLTGDLYAAARGAQGDRRFSTEFIRRRSNSLALRSTQAYLAASKGAGFVKGHPAERLVREAMFFLVWSCPQPVLAAALREFACLAEG